MGDDLPRNPDHAGYLWLPRWGATETSLC